MGQEIVRTMRLVSISRYAARNGDVSTSISFNAESREEEAEAETGGPLLPGMTSDYASIDLRGVDLPDNLTPGTDWEVRFVPVS